MSIERALHVTGNSTLAFVPVKPCWKTPVPANRRSICGITNAGITALPPPPLLIPQLKEAYPRSSSKALGNIVLSATAHSICEVMICFPVGVHSTERKPWASA